MKAFFLKALTMVALVLATAAGAQTSWDCGKTPGTVTATLSNWTLTINGSGDMADYNVGPPWYDSISTIYNVVIGDGVTSIGNRAFYGHSALRTVTIGRNVTKIGTSSNNINEVFFDCSGLTRIDVDDENTVYSSSGGVLFQILDLSDTVYYQGILLKYPQGRQGAYSIPYSVNHIRGGAFSGCTGLTSVTIPNSVLYIEWNEFAACSSLTNIDVGSGNTVCSSVDGVLFNKDRTVLIQYPRSKQGAYIIPDGVISVQFRNCTGLTSVTIPNSVTSINFSGCTGLTSVTIPNSVTSIGNKAFSGCTSLTSVTIPDSVTSIGDSAFSGCTNLMSVTIPDGVTSIGDWAFSGCTSLVSVTIPDGVISIGNWAFSGCTNLMSVTIPDGVTSIGNYAFYRCTGLKSVTIGNSVITIGTGAFYGCSGLTLVTIGNSVTSIEHQAFEYCAGLTSVTIPNSVIAIKGLAFQGCAGLTSVTIGNSITSISHDAFSLCNNLINIDVSSGNTRYSSLNGVLFNKDHDTLVIYPEGKQGAYIIPTSVTSIGEYAFNYCQGLTSVTIGNNVTSIGTWAFMNSTPPSVICLGEVPPNVGSYAFRPGSSCLLVPEASINAYLTANIWKDFSCIQPWEARTWDCGVTPGTLTATLSKKGTMTVSGTGAMADYYGGGTAAPWSGFIGFITNVVIDSGVTYIGANAFNQCRGLTSVTIGNDVTSLWSGFAFRTNYPNLTEVNVGDGNTVYSSVDGVVFNKAKDTLVMYPQGKHGAYIIPNSVTSIRNSAFYNCTGLTSVTIGNSVSSIESEAFYACSSLTSVTIPNSIASIGGSIFQYCSGLTSVTIPNSVTSIGTQMFYYCSGLMSVTIPNNVTSIDWGAFNGCTSLTSMTIPNSVTSIGPYAFYNCTGLTSVTIPNSVTSIGENAFNGCTGLTSVTNLATVPFNIIANAFENVPLNSACLYIPLTALSAYRAADVWKDFGCIQVVSGGFNVTFNSQGGNAVSSQYVLQGTNAGKPADPTREGYTFDGWYKEAACVNAWDFGVDVVTSAITLYAKWTPVYSITFSAGTNGALTATVDGSVIATGTLVQYGKSVVFTAIPDSGYKVSVWTLNGAAAANHVTNTYTLTDVSAASAVTVSFTTTISVLTPDRVIPQTKPNEEATVIAPVSQLTGEFTAGPNPVLKQSGIVKFYRQGKRVATCELRIYDATGNVISKVKISDKALNSHARRIVGSWDLKDKNGRSVPEGTYLVKGVVKTSDGKSEKVSVILGVR